MRFISDLNLNKVKKQVRIIIVLLIGILIFSIGSTKVFSQGTTSYQKDINNWRYQKKYNKILRKKYLHKGMTDDEMAGILLKRGSRNLNMSILFIGIGAFVASTTAWLPPLVIGENNRTNLTEQDVRYIIYGVATGCFITSLVKLIMGYHKIGDAGIVFQHKKFNVKTSGASISFNF